MSDNAKDAGAETAMEKVKRRRYGAYERGDGSIWRSSSVVETSDSESWLGSNWSDALSRMEPARSVPEVAVDGLLPPLGDRSHHFTDKQVMDAIGGTDYIAQKIRGRLNLMTSGEKYTLFRAIKTLVLAAVPVPPPPTEEQPPTDEDVADAMAMLEDDFRASELAALLRDRRLLHELRDANWMPFDKPVRDLADPRQKPELVTPPPTEGDVMRLAAEWCSQQYIGDFPDTSRIAVRGFGCMGFRAGYEAARTPTEGERTVKTNGSYLIFAERARQQSVHERTPEHDDRHDLGELSQSSVCYANLSQAQVANAVMDSDTDPHVEWPWMATWWKPSPDPIRNLVKAGALIAAEIDRLQRLAASQSKRGGE